MMNIKKLLFIIDVQRKNNFHRSQGLCHQNIDQIKIRISIVGEKFQHYCDKVGIKMSYLCVGPKNSGKTLLMSSLQYPGSVSFTTHSVNTVGTNIYTINSNSPATQKKNAKKSVNIRELGGEMAVMWKNYFNEDVEKIIFVVDTSNLCQISCAGVLLYSILVEPKLRKAQICLVLTKMDYAYRQMRNEALLMLQIDKLKLQVPQTITIIEASAISLEGLDQINEWIFK